MGGISISKTNNCISANSFVEKIGGNIAMLQSCNLFLTIIVKLEILLFYKLAKPWQVFGIN